MLRGPYIKMPQQYETHLKWVLITCAGVLTGSVGAVISVLSVIISPILSLISTPKPIFIGEGKVGATSRLQLQPEKIRPRHVYRPSPDKSLRLSSSTISSNSTTRSMLAASNGRRSPSLNGTRSYDDIHNAYESQIPPQHSALSLALVPSSPPKPRRTGLRIHLGIHKPSKVLIEPVPEEASPLTGNSELDQVSHEQKLDRAEIIVSPPTPSSSVFQVHSTPGPSEMRSGDVSTTGKPAARFSHSKRRSLTAPVQCPRKRRSGKVSPSSPTPKSKLPVTTPVAESRWYRASKRKKRKSLQIVPPPRSALSPMLINSGDAVGSEAIPEEPISPPQPPTTHLPLTPPRQGPVRTRPYEAPYFFPTPGSPEAIGYVERVREERRFAHPELTSMRSKKDLKRSYTTPSLEKDDNTRPHGEGGHDQATEDPGKIGPKSPGKGSETKNSNPSLSPTNESGMRVRTPILRKSSAPAQFSSSGTVSTPTTPNRPQTQRQGSQAIMRMFGKH